MRRAGVSGFFQRRGEMLTAIAILAIPAFVIFVLASETLDHPSM
jgi:hypothetical protein